MGCLFNTRDYSEDCDADELDDEPDDSSDGSSGGSSLCGPEIKTEYGCMLPK